MYKEVLNADQVELLPLLKEFKREFYLVGGTAIALQIGHRRSIDFDLFKFSPLKHKAIVTKISNYKFQSSITRRVTEQLNITINNVKFTFYQYPFNIPANMVFEGNIKMPDLIHLAAMKAYALGRRSKWKDYVDLYFFIKHHFTISEISAKASELFSDMFSEKLFRAQLTYFEDINYSEQIEYIGSPVPEDEIKAFLIDKATEW